MIFERRRGNFLPGKTVAVALVQGPLSALKVDSFSGHGAIRSDQNLNKFEMGKRP